MRLEEEWREEKLYRVEENEQREKPIAVDIESIKPFHLLLCCHHPLHPQISVRYKASGGGHCTSCPQEINQNRPDDDSQQMKNPVNSKRDAVSQRCNCNHAHQDHHERRVVSSPLIFNLSSNLCGLIQLPWCASAQAHHLGVCVLEVHLVKLEKSQKYSKLALAGAPGPDPRPNPALVIGDEGVKAGPPPS
eukprot:CAMPEP_0167817820 /NCGR_PEP_ID=MMETSP0112_2-20121227/4445_1 /TAXON_ID=91324 /ORGANISM="Lotharella globosa, Strain CCCM811" /LENGTH=190 /DNA_ID=CAMNT_0007717703 /DNA_START=543 /DNA_END=1113 /DNA_ORIENTATION=+